MQDLQGRTTYPATYNRAQVTDMDGTIADGEHLVLSTDFKLLNDLLQTRGLSAPFNDLEHFCQEMGGKSYDQILDITVQRLELPQLSAQERQGLILEEQEKVIEQIRAGNLKGCPHAAEVLREMIDAGAYVCISSSSTRPRLEATLEALGLRSLFPNNKIVSGQSDWTPPRPKPHPDCFLRSTRELLAAHPTAQVILGIEDSVGGIRGSQAAAKKLAVQGVQFHTVWYTGVIPTKLQDAWRPAVQKHGAKFEVADWRMIPELHDLLLNEKADEAMSKFSLKS